MAAAALGALGGSKAADGATQVLSQAVQGASSAFQAVLQALEKPIYADTRTTVVTHRAGNGDVITRTHTKGWTIPLGLVLGTAALVCVYEVGLWVAKGLSKIEGAIPNPAAIIAGITGTAWDSTGNLIAIGGLFGPLGDVAETGGLVWSWLTGTSAPGTSSASPPPETAKVVTMPASGMGALSQLVQYTVGSVSTPLSVMAPKFLAHMVQGGNSGGNTA